MAPKSKLKKSAAPDTPKKRGKQTGRRKQPMPEFPANHMGESSSDDSEPGLMTVMNLLVDMNTRVATSEQLLDDLRAETVVEEKSRLQSPSLTYANHNTSRGTTGRGAMTDPRHANHEALPAIGLGEGHQPRESSTIP